MLSSRTSAICGATMLWIGLTNILAANDAFFSGVADLPLMPGLLQDSEAGLVFDKPNGRIVEFYASGTILPAAVAEFYRRTLPQLGWTKTGNLEFTRDEEILRIIVTEKDGTSIARFTLSPRSVR